MKPRGISLIGKVTAVIGFGDVGKAIVKRLSGFEMTINVYDPFLNPNLDSYHQGLNLLAFPDRLSDADFVILACSLNQSNFEMINKNSIALMKDGVSIINVSRGGLINENDLLAGLCSNKVKSVALDVYQEEPIPLDHPLLRLNQCIFGSHNSSNTEEAVSRTNQEVIKILFKQLNVN